MVQTKKPEVRARVLEAAAWTFAEDGYEGATMAAIVRRAEASTGNVYRYFPSKDAIFDAVLPDALAATFLALVRRRVRSLARARSLTSLDVEARRDAEAMLAFIVAHRAEVIILLDRAAGSRHAGFSARFVDTLMRPTLAKLRADARTGRLPREARFLLDQIFRNTVRTLVAILEAHDDAESIRHAFEGFWSYQLAGLAGFSTWVKT